MSSSLKLPEIRIKYAWLLSDAASVPINELRGDGTPLQSADYYKKRAAHYETVWKPNEQTILVALSDMFGLTFRQNTIDVYVAPWFYAFSDPLVLGVILDDDQLITNLTHELIHRLLTDNNESAYDTDYMKQWKSAIEGKRDFNEFVHIPVHAALKAVYLDVLKRPELLKLDQKDVAHNEPYQRAWDYVEAHDYKQIIGAISASYDRKGR